MNDCVKKYITLMLLTFLMMAFNASPLSDNGADSLSFGKLSLNRNYNAGFSSLFNVSVQTGDVSSQRDLFQQSAADTPIIILLLLSLIIIITQIIKRARSYYIARLRFLKEENGKLKKEIEEKKIESRKLFSYLNHELKNALNSVQSASSLMYEHFEFLDEDERKTLQNTIMKSTGLLGRFFDTLFTWSHNEVDIENKKLELIEIFPVIVEETSKFDQLVTDKRIKIELNVNDSHAVYSDAAMLHIIINTVISNGIKYSHPGGAVVLTSKEIEDKIVITVKDSGVGFSKENLAQLFELKTVFNTNGPEGEKGTGLSLIICKMYVDALNGELNIDSAENEGSTISIKLPKNNH